MAEDVESKKDLPAAHIRVLKEPEYELSPKAATEIYIRTREGDTFHTVGLIEGILHLLSTNGLRLTVKEFPEGKEDFYEKPEYAVRIWRGGNDLGVRIEAPMIDPFGKMDEIKWKDDYVLTGLDTRPKGQIVEESLNKILDLPESQDPLLSSEEIQSEEIQLDVPNLPEDEKPITSILRYDATSFLDPVAPLTEVKVEIVTKNGEIYCVPTLGEGVIHLISKDGHQIKISEISSYDKSIYSIVVQRNGNQLSAKLIAPVLKNTDTPPDNTIVWLASVKPPEDVPTQADIHQRTQAKPEEIQAEELLEIKFEPF